MGKVKKYDKLDQIPKGQAKEIIQSGCLVIEGGAFRGLYNQGVLDAFMLNDINVHTVIGVSAGALAGLNYISGQIGRSARANLGFRYDSRYVGLRALKNGHSIVDINFLLDTLNEYEPLNSKMVFSDNRHFVVVATNCLTGETMYYDKDNCSNILYAIKASASMPYITPMVDVDGTPCLDGGCSCKIAYKWALDNNFEKIIIIKTRERGYRKPQKSNPMAKLIYGKYPAFVEALNHSDYNYNKQCEEIDELEAKKRAYVLAPSQPVTVKRIEKDLDKLGNLYWLGYNDAQNQMSQIKQYLS